MKKAIFDLDGTILENSAGLLLAQEINRLGKFKNWTIFAKSQELIKNSRTSFDYAISQLSRLFALGIKGLNVSSMNEGVQELESKIKIRNSFSSFYKYLKNCGFKMYLLTSSPFEATKPLTKIFPFDMVFSLEFEIANGKYTGNYRGPLTTERKKRLVDEEILQNAVFSFGVGDSCEDMYIFQNTNVRFLFANNLSSEPKKISFIKVKNFNEIIETLEKL